MAEILVKPTELRQVANELHAHAKRLQTAIDSVDNDMRTFGPSTFEGIRADTLRARYNKIRERIYQIKPLISRFATDIDEAASRFDAADRV